MARVVNFTRIIANGRTEPMSVSEDKMVRNDIGISWKVDDKTVRCIPYTQILEITMKEV